jgi:hypothetical protein
MERIGRRISQQTDQRWRHYDPVLALILISILPFPTRLIFQYIIRGLGTLNATGNRSNSIAKYLMVDHAPSWGTLENVSNSIAFVQKFEFVKMLWERQP